MSDRRQAREKLAKVKMRAAKLKRQPQSQLQRPGGSRKERTTGYGPPLSVQASQRSKHSKRLTKFLGQTVNLLKSLLQNVERTFRNDPLICSITGSIREIKLWPPSIRHRRRCFLKAHSMASHTAAWAAHKDMTWSTICANWVAHSFQV